jgi:hypothetical protein
MRTSSALALIETRGEPLLINQVVSMVKKIAKKQGLVPKEKKNKSRKTSSDQYYSVRTPQRKRSVGC